MGLFDIFLSKDERIVKMREKNIARGTDKYKQSPDRLRALELLLEDGSEDALYGILRRFGVKHDKSIDDEQEKEWVCRVLITRIITLLHLGYTKGGGLRRAEYTGHGLLSKDGLKMDRFRNVLIFLKVFSNWVYGYVMTGYGTKPKALLNK